MVDFACESFEKIDSIQVRPWETQLQHKNDASSVGCPVCEAKGGSSHMRQLEP